MVIPITSEISMYQWWWLSVFCIPAISQLYLNYIPVNYIPITHWYPNNIPIHKSLFLQNPYTIKKWSRRGNLHDSGHWRRWCLHPLWCMAPECPRGRRQGRMNGFAEADFLGESGGYVYIYVYIYICIYIYTEVEHYDWGNEGTPKFIQSSSKSEAINGDFTKKGETLVVFPRAWLCPDMSWKMMTHSQHPPETQANRI